MRRRLEIMFQGAEWLLLVAAIAAMSATEAYTPYVGAAVLLLAVATGLRIARTKRLVPHTGLEIPALIFLLTAGLAAWLTYDRGPAFLQFARTLAAAVLFYAVIDSGPVLRELLAAGLVALSAGLAVYWALHNDFTLEQVKIDPLYQAGLWISANLPHLPGPYVHPNIAAGALLLGLPFALALVWQWGRQRRTLPTLAAMTATILIVAGLLLTRSRGALTGLLVGVVFIVLLVIQRRRFSSTRRAVIFWIEAGLAGLAGIFLLYGLGILDRLIGNVTVNGALLQRTEVWAQALPLARDYALTGIGLGLPAIHRIHGLYGVLMNTPVASHLHNSYLQILVSQGVFGMFAFLSGAAVIAKQAVLDSGERRWQSSNILGIAALGTLVAAAVHGVVDVVFYLNRTLPLVGFAAGFIFLAQPANRREVPAANEPGKQKTSRAVRYPTYLAIAVVLISALVIPFQQPIRALYHANAGAILQTRIEMQRFDPAHFDNPSLDTIRRTTDLSAVQAHFHQALALEPFQITALQRLAEIALAQGQYDLALVYTQTAWEAGYRDENTRLLLGDALVANGKPADAAAVLTGLHWAENRLMYQAWYRYWNPDLGDRDLVRSMDAWRAVLILNPNNITAAEWLAREGSDHQ